MDSDQSKVRQFQIPGQLDRLSSEVSELEKVVDVLRDKLQPVLRNKPPGVAATQKDEEDLVDVANSIKVNILRIRGVIEVVSDVVESLEI